MNTLRIPILVTIMGVLSGASSYGLMQNAFEEIYIGSSELVSMQGPKNELGVLSELGVKQGSYIESLIVTSSSAQGFGKIEVLVDGRIIGVLNARETITAEQIPIRAEVGRDLRTLRLRGQGNIQIAHYAVTVNGRLSHGDVRPRPGEGQRPGQPSHPGMGQIVDQAEFQSLIMELKRASFDSSRENIVSNYMSFWSRKLLTMDQLAQIVGLYSFDSGKLKAVQLAKSILIVDLSRLNQVLSQFSFDSTRDQARNMIMK